MPEHIHLLLSEPQEKNLSLVMQSLKLGFARRVRAGGGGAAIRRKAMFSSRRI